MGKVHAKAIPHIERALGIKLYEHQKNYLINEGSLNSPNGERQTGKTTAYCIMLALSDGDPLNLQKPEEFSDGWTLPHRIAYSRGFFRNEFMYIRGKLENYGFRVRDVKFGGVRYE